jgi:hypothetical protein
MGKKSNFTQKKKSSVYTISSEGGHNTLNRACRVSRTSFRREEGQAGSDSSQAMIDFNSSRDSCGFCIHIKALTTIARTYTHSHATVVRTTSISDASNPATVSNPPCPLDSGLAFRVATTCTCRVR